MRVREALFLLLLCILVWINLSFVIYHYGSSRVVKNFHDSSQQTDQLVTVAMLNWQRKANVLTIIEVYLEYSRVAQIIVWMCRNDTK